MYLVIKSKFESSLLKINKDKVLKIMKNSSHIFIFFLMFFRKSQFLLHSLIVDIKHEK